MELYDEQPDVAEEPQHDEDDEGDRGGDDFGMDLLQRARLLCQAANEIALPMLQSVQQLQDKFTAKEPKTKKKTSRPSTREGDDEKKRERPVSKPTSKPGSRKEPRTGSSAAATKLPAIGNTTKLPQLVKPKPPLPAEPQHEPEKKAVEVKPVVKKKVKKKEEPVAEEDAVLPLPKSNATDEWRKEREAEKIRQAQERAKARVLRVSKQVEVTKSNQQSEAQAEERECDQDSEERLKQVEAYRRRAEERVRRRKLEQAEQQTRQEAKQEQVPERLPEETVKRAEAFRLRTLQRLQAARREAQQQQEQAERMEAEAAEEAHPTSGQFDAEEAEKERKRLEKRRRKETAERLKRQQQIADEQQRKEQEIFEKGLNEFKTKKKEQDRVAKGLQPARPKSELDERSGNQVTIEHAHLEGPAHVVEPEAAKSDEVPEEETPPNSEETLSHTVEAEDKQQIDKTLQPLSSGVKTKSKKLPPWKKPCVPILPAESYSQKAMLSPSESYAERFRSGRSSPNTTPVNASMPSKLQQARAQLASASE